MTLVKRNQHTFPSVWNNFFDTEILNPNNFFGQTTKNALVNITDHPTHFSIDLEVPGFKKEDIKINLNDGVLTVEGQFEVEKKQSESRSIRKEFSKTAFKRSFNLPETVDFEKISAKYEDGILTISIDKKEEVVVNNKRQIEIH